MRSPNVRGDGKGDTPTYLVTLKQVSWHSTAASLIHRLVFILAFVMHGNGFLHCRLLCVPLLCEDLGLKAQYLLGEGGALVNLQGHVTRPHTQKANQMRKII